MAWVYKNYKKKRKLKLKISLLKSEIKANQKHTWADKDKLGVHLGSPYLSYAPVRAAEETGELNSLWPGTVL